jgi:N-glycosylase/DNA lyase
MDFFARRDEIIKERRRLLREKNGYVPGAHREEDSIRNKDKKLDKTKQIHQQTLNLWLEYVDGPASAWRKLTSLLASQQTQTMNSNITKLFPDVYLRAMMWLRDSFAGV